MAYKQRSGAQNRKIRAEKDAKAARTAKEATSPQRTQIDLGRDPNTMWDGSPNPYAMINEIWNPDGPPIEIPIYGQPPTTFMRAVQSTLIQLEQGQFWQASYLWDGMTRDDRVAAKLSERIDRLIGSNVVMEPANEDDDGAQQIADDAKRQFFKMLPYAQQYELMRAALGLSVGIAHVETTRTLKSWTPTIKVFNNRFLRYDWSIRQFRLITQNKGEITLYEDDPEWIIYQPFGPLGWLHGAFIRSIVTPWLIRYWTRTWWSRYQEVHGQPIRGAIIPPTRTPRDEKRFMREVGNFAHETVILLPQGENGNHFDMKLIEAQSDNWQGFKELLAHCDDSIAIAILGQSQSTKGQGGLGTQENAGESTISKLTRKDALVGELLREKVLVPWARDNFKAPDSAPYIVWEHEPPKDEVNASKTDFAIAQAAVQFKLAAAPIDFREWLTQRGYPLITEAEEAALKAETEAKEQKQNEMKIAATKKPQPTDDEENAK